MAASVDTTNPKGSDVRKMVAAHGKCPDDKKPAFRKTVIEHARKAGALQHIPDAWLRGKPGKPSDKVGD
jgi:hypothetical protein